MKGVGVCAGYADSMKILLNMAGIRCMNVIGKAYGSKGMESHEWNMVRINDVNYQLDATWDDPNPDNGSVYYKYFNVSDAQMALDHEWEKSDYPVCNTDSQYVAIYNKSHPYFAYGDDYQIWVDMNYNLKKQLKNSEERNFIEEKVLEIRSSDDFLYYINEEDQFIYKINFDGTGKQRLNSLKSYILNIIGNQIIYLGDDSKIYRMDLDGNNSTIIWNQKTDWYCIEGDWIFYKNWEADGWTDGGKLYKVKLDGTQNTKILDEVAKEIIIEKEWIYYTNRYDNSKIYSIKTDGTCKQRLNTDNSSKIDIIYDWVYYTDVDGSRNIYRIKKDGSWRSVINF